LVMCKKVLEVNVDDQNAGGVFSLVKNVIVNNDSETKIDIAALEKFEKQTNVELLKTNNCTVHYVGYEGNKLIKQIKIYKNIKALLQKEHYDYVHIHADVANKMMVSGFAAKHCGKCTIIFHSHSSGAEGNHQIARRLIHFFCRTQLKRIKSINVACSDNAAMWMFSNDNNVIIVKNGIDVAKFRYDEKKREQIRNDLQIKNEVIIGHVGRFMYAKNHVYIVDIAEELRKRGFETKILLIGEGEYKETVEKIVKERNLQSMFIFFGLADNVEELLQAMDIFVLPSLFEGFPIVGVEAQAAGLPCIFSEAITKDLKLIESVAFLPTGTSNISRWANKIETFGTNSGEMRKHANQKVKEKGYDIINTISSFIRLYQQ